MTGIVGLGAVAGRFTAATDYGSNRTGSKIAQAEELFQELGAIGFEGSERGRHVGSFLSLYI